jgi:hypothetical protein
MATSSKDFDRDSAFTSYPSPLEPQKTKEKPKYILQYIRAMYSEYVSSQNTYEETRRRFVLNRKYSEGLQSVEKYKTLIGVQGDTAYMNLDYSVLPILPKFVDIIVNEMSNLDFDFDVQAIDSKSRTEKDKVLDEIYANMYLKALNDYTKEMTGKGMVPEDSFVPDTPEEAELYISSYKLGYEIAMKDAIRYVLQQNDWQWLKRKIFKDLVDCKRAAIWPYFDENGNIQIAYSDVVNTGTSRVQKDNFADANHQWVILEMPMWELRKMAQGQLSNEDIESIVDTKNDTRTRGTSLGTSGIDGMYYDKNTMFSNNQANVNDQFKVDVFYGAFKTTDKYTYKKKPNKKGGFFFEKVDNGYKVKEGEQLEQREIENIYHGYWIIGTDYIIKSGRLENIPRQRNLNGYNPDAPLPILMIAPNIKDMQNKSFVERAIPHADQVQLLHLKIQQLVAKTRPKGVAINLDAVEHVVEGMGQGKVGPLDVQSIYDQTGTFYYRNRDAAGNPILTKPIDELENGISNDVFKFYDMIAREINMIRDVTGLNDARDGSSPSKDSLIGLQKLALQASNNATREIWDAFVNLTERLLNQIMLMVQYKAKYGGGLSGFYNAIGENKIRLIEIGADVAAPLFGIAIEIGSDESEKAKLQRWIEVALSSQNIDLEDAIELDQMENTKQAIQSLILRRKKRMRENSERAAMDSQNNAQQQAMAAQVKGQADMMKEQAKGQNEAKLIALEAEAQSKLAQEQLVLDVHLEKVKSDNRIREIYAAGAAELDEKELSGETREPGVKPTPNK